MSAGALRLRLQMVACLAALAVGAAVPRAAPAQDRAVADVVAKLLPSVVNISVLVAARSPGTQVVTLRRSEGAGFIVDPSGLVLTNRHVVDGAREVSVMFADGTQFKAEVALRAPNDLALLRVGAPGPLPVVTWGDSDRMRPGDPVIAIGNPLGLRSTVTAGIVSAVDRGLKDAPLETFIQTDAALNQGNSGGPLFNKDGEVIGVNAALMAPSGESSSAGLGMAIPAKQAHAMVESYLQSGRIRAGWLGASLVPVARDEADAIGLPVPWGSAVVALTDGGPASRSGLRLDDVILGVDGQPVRETRLLTSKVAAAPAGAKLSLGIWRDGAESSIDVIVADAPNEALQPPLADAPPLVEQRNLGLILVAPTDKPQGQAGVLVKSVAANSIAAARGIKAGDLIVKTSLRPVSTPAEIAGYLDDLRVRKQASALLVIENKAGHRWVTLPLAVPAN